MTLDSELDGGFENQNQTPTKTLTPSSNPSTTSPQDNFSSWDNSVFANVMIGPPGKTILDWNADLCIKVIKKFKSVDTDFGNHLYF